MSTKNYDVVLGIAEDADDDTIRSAFRALGMTLPPGCRTGFIHC
jgi:DnaJ-class molecular chaperone